MALKDIEKKCNTCVYCYKYKDGDFGQCRAYPPVINKEKSVAEYPVVSLKWWCGIHTPNKEMFLANVEFDHTGHLNG
jgi:hypothetical protein